MAPNLREIVKKRIMSDMVQAAAPGKWKIMVVDPSALKILKTACKMEDIIDEKVTVVEDIFNKSRQPYPTQDAIYFISPNNEAVSAFIDDFKAKPMYARAHVYCTAGLPDRLLQSIKRSPALQYTKTLTELNVDFLAVEPQVFTFDAPNKFFAFFNPPSAAHLNYEIEVIAKRLTSVLVTLGEYPFIRFYDPDGRRETLSAKLGLAIQKEMDEYCRIESDFPPQSPYPRAILIVTDRTLDVMAPLLHEFTYQAMIYDLLTLDGNQYTYKSDEGVQKVMLDESDAIWTQIRHQHFADASNHILDSFKTFLENNKAAASSVRDQQSGNRPKGLDSLKEMQDTISALPQFQELKKQFAVHINICRECQSAFEEGKYSDIGAIEQDLATGESADGKHLKDMMVALVPLLDNTSVLNADKLRLLALYIIAQEGIQDDARRRLLEHARLSAEESQGITNLSILGVRLSSRMQKTREQKGRYTYWGHKLEKKGKKRRDDDMPYDLSRYIPIHKYILEDQVENCVDVAIFPWIKEPPPSDIGPAKATWARAGGVPAPGNTASNSASLRTTKPSWAQRRVTASGSDTASVASTSSGSSSITRGRDEDLRRNGPRVILFILGGITYSEMRAAYEVMRKSQREVIVGSTAIMTPSEFVDDIKWLDKGAVPSMASRTQPRKPAYGEDRSSSKVGGGSRPQVGEVGKAVPQAERVSPSSSPRTARMVKPPPRSAGGFSMFKR
ncbi:hypothetical protein SeMB42_g00060 [Synchytrium endobioticum]|uniref:Sec1-like protein n=1 Tax=Synchytrium endobioticum TaxID=286115 RepID=A0A507DUZ0_9FUNG|nr:hypothetical protein SeLEV6574_g03537 [Synchytrium endobioticum]TPX55017.1 hypothetical protein SeMB42_g00060 [Synchytrium endobioticum]